MKKGEDRQLKNIAQRKNVLKTLLEIDWCVGTKQVKHFCPGSFTFLKSVLDYFTVIVIEVLELGTETGTVKL